MRSNSVVVSLCVLASFASAAPGQCVPKLLASDGAGGHWLGLDVAIGGDLVLASAPRGRNARGAVYVFRRNGVELSKLLPRDPETDHWFGVSVAFHDNLAVIGAPHDQDLGGSDMGSVYLFDVSNPAAPVELSEFRAMDLQEEDYFGHSVAASGDIIVVGMPMDHHASPDPGAVYLFDISDPRDPVQICRVAPPIPDPNGHFGIAVACSGHFMVIGEYGVNGHSGRAWAYDISDPANPELLCELIRGDPAPDDFFGWSVANHGSTAVIGAHRDDHPAAIDGGSAFLFDLATSGCPEAARLAAPDPAAQQNFGVSVASWENTVLVGAWGDSRAGNRAGAAYLFDVSDPGSPVVRTLIAHDAAPDAYFGSSVALGPDTAVVGAYKDDELGGDAGAAYVFEERTWGGCTADINCDGVVDDDDLRIVLGTWGQCPPVCAGDVNGDGVVNVLDLMDVLVGWGICPESDGSQASAVSDGHPANAWTPSNRGDGPVVPTGPVGHDAGQADVGLAMRTPAGLDEADGAVVGTRDGVTGGPDAGTHGGRARDGGTPVCGWITQDTRWSPAGSPYEITCTVSVAAGVTLTIEPGTEVTSLSYGRPIHVYGALRATGARFTDHARFRADGTGTVDLVDCEATSPDCNHCLWFTGESVGTITDCRARELRGNDLSHVEVTGTSITFTHFYENSTADITGSTTTILNFFDSSVGLLRGCSVPQWLKYHDSATGTVIDCSAGQIDLFHSSRAVDCVFTETDRVNVHTPTVTVRNCSFLDEATYWAHGSANETYDATMNRWGTVDPGAIELKIVDRRDDPSRPLVEYVPFLRPADINGDGVVDDADLQMLFAAWGPCPACPEDVNGDRVANVLDLLEVLLDWGSHSAWDDARIAVTPLPCAHPSFGDATFHDAGARPWAVALGDLDDDLDVDLVVTNLHDQSVSVLLNDGHAGFRPRVSYTVGTYPNAVTLGDVDDDQDLDMAISHYDDDNVVILVNRGDGSFVVDRAVGTGDAPLSVALADLDGDRHPDIVVANSGSDDVSVLINDGVGGFAPQVRYQAGDMPSSVAVGDLDGDHDPDLVVANRHSDDVSVLLNDGRGMFSTPPALAAGDYPISAVSGDLDGDEDLDLVVSNHFGDDILILLNDGNATFVRHGFFDAGDAPVYPSLGDVDGDRNLDLVIPNVLAGEVSILLNDGHAGFGALVPYGVGDDPNALALADLDGDEELALVVAVERFASVLLNVCNAACPSDINGDGLVDVLDLLDLLTAWGPCPTTCTADINGDGIVDRLDLLELLAAWGPCP